MSAAIQTYIDTPVGQLNIVTDDQRVQSISFVMLDSFISSQETSVITEQAGRQLTSYFRQAHTNWSLPLLIKGTDFQCKVWRYLQTIPIGETRTYLDVAEALTTSARAVANACRANSFSIVIPCHRVISRSGLGGYYGKTAGQELAIKQWLLDHERRG